MFVNSRPPTHTRRVHAKPKKISFKKSKIFFYNNQFLNSCARQHCQICDVMRCHAMSYLNVVLFTPHPVSPFFFNFHTKPLSARVQQFQCNFLPVKKPEQKTEQIKFGTKVFFDFFTFNVSYYTIFNPFSFCNLERACPVTLTLR